VARSERKFEKLDNNEFHEVRVKIEAIFQERLDLDKEQSEKLFRSYSEHYSNANKMQQASNKYFAVEEKIQECADNDIVAKTAIRGLRDYYAQSVNAPFEYNGDVSKEEARVSQAVNYQNMLAKRLAEYHNIPENEAMSIVDKFSELQHQNAKQLVQTRINDGGRGM
jgi:hypothetical protein